MRVTNKQVRVWVEEIQQQRMQEEKKSNPPSKSLTDLIDEHCKAVKDHCEWAHNHLNLIKEHCRLVNHALNHSNQGKAE